MKKPSVWSVLTNDDTGDVALVVPALTDPTGALLELIDQVVGERFSRDNPAIAREAANLKVARWHSCSKAWRESMGVDLDEDYWAEDGDGGRTIDVVYVARSLDAIAEDAIAEEAALAALRTKEGGG